MRLTASRRTLRAMTVNTLHFFGPSMRVIRVQGEDARSWLNGQVTQDVRNTKAGDSVYALIANVKGKIIADTWVLDCDGSFLLTVPSSASDVNTHLEQYIIMEDVELKDEPYEVASIQTNDSSLRAAVHAALGQDVISYPSARLLPEGFDVLLVGPAAREHLIAFAAAHKIAIANDDDWARLHVTAGVPRFSADFGPANYPQEAGLKELAVSFNKGCYLGQEVVCMLENRGQLVRKLVHFEMAEQAKTGAPIMNEAGAEIGRVTSCVSVNGVAFGLGYAKRAHAVAGHTLHIESHPAKVIGVVGEPPTP